MRGLPSALAATSLAQVAERGSHAFHGNPAFGQAGYVHHGHHDYDHHDHSRGPGMGGLIAGAAAGVVGGMILGEVLEEVFEDDGGEDMAFEE